MLNSSRRGLLFTAALPVLLLGGCATFDGQPKPVISVAMSDAALDSYKIPGILEEYARRTGNPKRAYRDEVVAVYTQAIDARFYQFRADLGSEGKSSGLGFDLLLLGLAGVTALSSKAADEIAVVTTGALGLHSSVDKNLYFDRTLPALLSAMEAERYKVRKAIAVNLGRDTTNYPLAAALVQLQEYQQAGTLLSAVAAVTSQAGEAREEAKAQFERVKGFACASEDEVNLAIDPVGRYLGKLSQDAYGERASGSVAALNRMRQAADVLGVKDAGTLPLEKLDLAIDQAILNGFCTLDEVAALKTELKGANIGFVGN